MSARLALAVGALCLVLGVGAGAFGAHALRARIPSDLLAIFQTGVQYHLVHALGMVALAVLMLARPDAAGFGIVAMLLLAGIVLFSGSLYVLALTGVRGWGAVTPFGGVAWLAAWSLLAWRALRL